LDGFNFRTKTSTQADNATEGPTKYKLFITAFKDEDRQRDPRETEGPWERHGALRWGIPMLFVGRQGPWRWGIPMQFWALLRS